MTYTRIRALSASWLWIAAIWCGAGLFDASQTVLIMHAEGRHEPWLPLFATELASWIPWALATPLIVSLARRFPLNRGVDARGLLVHIGTFAALSALSETWSAWLQVLCNPWGNRKWPTFVDTWTTSLVFQAFTFLIAYALILATTYLVDARESIARERAASARLNEELSRAQLAALRRQMEPHFIYNTLNSIAALVRDQRNDAAVNMLVGLSEFLRRASEDSHRSQVSLAEEVQYLKRYLDLQQVRFGDRLRVSVDIQEEILSAQVPSLLLQPLVENAVKHGIAKCAAGGALRVAGRYCDGNVHLSVYNDGTLSLPDGGSAHSGVGIGNLRTRLQILHGEKSALHLKRVDGGVEVIVTLPFMAA